MSKTARPNPLTCLVTCWAFFWAVALSAQPLKLASGEKEPYIGQHLSNQGYVHELVQEILHRMELEASIGFFPWERARILVEKGDLDGLISTDALLTNQRQLVVSQGFPGEKLGLLKSKETEFTLPPNFRTGSEEDLQALAESLAGMRIGLVRGADSIAQFQKPSGLRTQYINTYEQGMQMLASGRIELLLIDKYTAADIMTDKLPHLIGQLDFLDPPLLERQFHLALNRANPKTEALIQAFNSELTRALSDGTLATLMERHGFITQPTVNNSVHRITIGTVDNNDMIIMRELSQEFEKEHPNIQLSWQVLDESILRRRLMSDLAISDGQYDVMTIGTLEAPLWAERGWLVPIAEASLPEQYDVDDLIPTVREGLSFNATLYALPFYAESTMTYYRTDLFTQAGFNMPEAPTYDDILRFAARLHKPDEGVYGICLRGKPNWGENMAYISMLVNTFGGRWFDEEWNPTIDSPEWKQALTLYRTLVTQYGPPMPSELGFTELIELFSNGHCAMWIDATVAAGTLFDPENSIVANSVGTAATPVAVTTKGSNWLWSWALAVPTSSTQQEAALAFISWATSKEYIQLVGERKGWVFAPPGTRTSTYENPNYQQAAPFSRYVVNAIQSADINDSTLKPSPYVGIQLVRIPEFPAIGVNVGREVARMVEGRSSIDETLAKSQSLTQFIMIQAGY